MLAPSTMVRSDLLFNAQPHPLRSAVGALPVPKPDYAFGFQLSGKRLNTESSTLDPFSKDFIERLKEKPGLYLKPHVNVCKPVSTLIHACCIRPESITTELRASCIPDSASQTKLVYPFFCFEAKSSIGSPYAAANQLANDLAFALGLLLHLRRDAGGDDSRQDDPLMVFGGTSSGSCWSIYVAWETDRNTSGHDVVSAIFWTSFSVPAFRSLIVLRYRFR
jgi:hypothetical protein